MSIDYLQLNKDSWNKRTDIHVKSDFYQNEAFISGLNSLKEIELSLLGDIAGKRILHLQCHFGQDSISLARMGAHVTGVDLSDKAIKAARELATQCGQQVTFIESDIYALPQYLDEQFDIVFTSYGTIGWLPDINKWAEVVGRFLSPEGQFIFAEFHPLVWMFDDDFKKVTHRYFNAEPIIEQESGTYAERSAGIESTCVLWNHGMAEVMTALLSEGLELNDFREYDYSPYDCFAGTVEFEPGKYRIAHMEDKLPMVYALRMTKR